LTAVQTYR